MADLQARFQINHVKGAVLGYVYSREATELFFPDQDPAIGAARIKVGDLITVEEDKQMEVKSIITYLYPEKYGTDTSYGVGIHNVDEITPYDITILLTVDDI